MFQSGCQEVCEHVLIDIRHSTPDKNQEQLNNGIYKHVANFIINIQIWARWKGEHETLNNKAPFRFGKNPAEGEEISPSAGF